MTYPDYCTQMDLNILLSKVELEHKCLGGAGVLIIIGGF